jgi:glycosyltransferase involved in cell wall biosynthesis
MKPRISVVTVTYNNAAGLAATLQSVAELQEKPFEILVIDGSSTDDTRAVVDRCRPGLPIRFVTEPDRGIYDAMNKGQRLATGDLLHYLNAGDVVWGEPYRGIEGPCLLPARICSPAGDVIFEDFVKIAGYSYCHQGMILPARHEPYNTGLRVVADLEMVIGTYPRGLEGLPRQAYGGVNFFLGGVSSSQRALRDREIRAVLMRRLPFFRACAISLALMLKSLVPGGLRQQIARVLSRRRQNAAR